MRLGHLQPYIQERVMIQEQPDQFSTFSSETELTSESQASEASPSDLPRAGAAEDTAAPVGRELPSESEFAEPDDGMVSVDRETLNQLTTESESLRAQLEDRTGQYMRLAADFENYRKRTQSEKEELEQQAKRKTLGELLPVIDSFERARSQIKPTQDEAESIHKSYQGIYKQLVDCLKRIGVAPMRSEGKPFDPNMHEAVMREASDEQPEGTVLEELVRGYLLGDKVLRHAMVKVAAPPEAVVASESEDA
jgi:molecular chaperone GrpE